MPGEPDQISILIVEDEAIIAMAMQGDLVERGYAVAGIAHQGSQALEIIEQTSPNLVLMDINLRGDMDGIQTAVQIRERYKVPVIFLTAMVDQATVERAKKAVPYGYLVKPTNQDELWAMIENVLHKHQLEVRLDQSETRFRELFETSLDGVLATDLDGTILECNTAFAKILGCAPSELLQQKIQAFTPEEYNNYEKHIYRTQVIIRGYSDELFKEYFRVDGKRVSASLRFWLRRDAKGSPAGIWAIVRDLTELRRSQSDLLESEQRFQHVVDYHPNGIFLTDTEGVVLNWNPATEVITGLPAVEAVKNSLSRLQAQLELTDVTSTQPVPPTGMDERVPFHPQALTEKIDSRLLRIRTPQGEQKFVEETTYPIQTQNRRIFVHILNDVTDRQLMEEKARRQTEFALRMADFSARLNAQLEVGAILDILCEQAERIFMPDLVAVMLFDPEHENLSLDRVCGADAPREWDLPLVFPVDASSGKFLEVNPVLAVHDLDCEMQDSRYFDVIKRLDLRSAALAKMLNETRPIGMIVLASVGAPRRFSEEELAFLTTFASQAAVAIDHARLYEQTRQRTQELEILGRLSSQLRLVDTQLDMLPILLDEAMEWLQAECGTIFLLDNQRGQVAQFERPEGKCGIPRWFRSDHPIWKQILSDQEILLVQNPETDLNSGAATHNNAILFIPLCTSRIVMGMIALEISAHFSLDPSIRRVLQALAETAGNALHRSGLMELLEQRVANRNRELATLYDLALYANQPLELEDMLQGSLEKVVSAVNAQTGLLYQYTSLNGKLILSAHVNAPIPLLSAAHELMPSGEAKEWLEKGGTPWLSFKGEKLPPYFPARVLNTETMVNIPVRFEGQTHGLLCVYWMVTQDIVVENIALLSAVAERLGSAIHQRQLQQKAEDAAVIQERQRLARDLHDSVTQSLYSLPLLAEAGQDLLSQNDLARLDTCLSDMKQSSLQALREMRLMLYELRAPLVEEMGLVMALQNRLEAVEQRAGMRVRFNHDLQVHLAGNIQEEIYRVACEALNNILKHASATELWMTLASENDRLNITIEDNGEGFDIAHPSPSGMGLTTMRERVERMGGEIAIQSRSGLGTKILISLGG